MLAENVFSELWRSFSMKCRYGPKIKHTLFCENCSFWSQKDLMRSGYLCARCACATKAARDQNSHLLYALCFKLQVQ
jgi:hypothetical protein